MISIEEPLASWVLLVARVCLASVFLVSGVAQAVVSPRGVSWPSEKKDEEPIYTDMLQLGAQLNEYSIGLGDGGKANIKIPIE